MPSVEDDPALSIFRYSVCCIGYRQEATEVERVRRGYNSMSGRGQVPYVTREMTSCLNVVAVGSPVVWPSPPPSRRDAPAHRACDEQWCNSSCGYDHVIITHFLRRKSACARCSSPCVTLCPQLPCSAASETMMGTLAAERVVATPFFPDVQEQQWTPQNKFPSPEADSRSASHEILLIL